MWQCAGLGGLSMQMISGFVGINKVFCSIATWVGRVGCGWRVVGHSGVLENLIVTLFQGPFFLR